MSKRALAFLLVVASSLGLVGCSGERPPDDSLTLAETRSDARALVSSIFESVPSSGRSRTETIDDRVSPCSQAGDSVRQWVVRERTTFEDGVDSGALARGVIDALRARGWLARQNIEAPPRLNVLLVRDASGSSSIEAVRITSTPATPQLSASLAVGASGPCVTGRK